VASFGYTSAFGQWSTWASKWPAHDLAHKGAPDE
jgi:hypothetical protein